MCGRYYMDIDDKEIKKIADEAEKNIYQDYSTGEIFPSDVAPILVSGQQGPRPILAKWGFPKWDGKGIIINARLESAEEKQMFKNLVSSGRCIVPASAYFEWKKEEASKTKYIIHRDNSILYMAGLYTAVQHEHRQMSIFEQRDTDICYTIITRDASPSVSFIHNRMPLIFDSSGAKDYLNGRSMDNLLEISAISLLSRAVR
ncbi:MAG: SOS response-associated peptidase [Sedimentibacter sp.]|uniref:SOS response-associated peptidase n=1 Tax=Sedimentibacter sp. TaxID=1960295 RepID=UPI0031596230